MPIEAKCVEIVAKKVGVVTAYSEFLQPQGLFATAKALIQQDRLGGVFSPKHILIVSGRAEGRALGLAAASTFADIEMIRFLGYNDFRLGDVSQALLGCRRGSFEFGPSAHTDPRDYARMTDPAELGDLVIVRDISIHQAALFGELLGVTARGGYLVITAEAQHEMAISRTIEDFVTRGECTPLGTVSVTPITGAHDTIMWIIKHEGISRQAVNTPRKTRRKSPAYQYPPLYYV